MDIRQFVSETLRQINGGIADTHKEKDMIVAPGVVVGTEGTSAGHMIIASGDVTRPVVLIKFGLTVVVQAKVAGGAEAKISVLGIGGGGEVSGAIDQTRTQRIEFSLPVAFSHTPHEWVADT